MITGGPSDGAKRRLGADPLRDPLLAEQYFDRLIRRASDMPEKRLMLAVLLDAIVHLHRPGSAGAAEAGRWILSESRSPFTFINICEALGIEATYLTRGLLAWRANPGGRRFALRHARTSTTRIAPLRIRRRRRRVARCTH